VRWWCEGWRWGRLRCGVGVFEGYSIFFFVCVVGCLVLWVGFVVVWWGGLEGWFVGVGWVGCEGADCGFGACWLVGFLCCVCLASGLFGWSVDVLRMGFRGFVGFYWSWFWGFVVVGVTVVIVELGVWWWVRLVWWGG